jgi:hypothetical protein
MFKSVAIGDVLNKRVILCEQQICMMQYFFRKLCELLLHLCQDYLGNPPLWHKEAALTKACMFLDIPPILLTPCVGSLTKYFCGQLIKWYGYV